jgi:dipeptidyl aminopeptidase/acylaminoacyl peptidase
MRLHSTLLCACLATCFSNLQAAPTVPLSSFVKAEQFYNPSLSPDGKHIAVTVRIANGDRFVPIVTFYTLPELKIVGQIGMSTFDVPLDYYWVNNTRLIITKGKELGSRERPVATGEVLATELDGSKQEYLYGYKMFQASSRGDRYGSDYGHGSVADLPRELNGHFFLASHSWEGGRSMLYDIDAKNATRKLLADLPERYLSFVLQGDGKPRFGVGSDDDNEQVLYRYNENGDNWSKVDFVGTHLAPAMFSADNREFVATYSANGEPAMLIKEDLASGKRVTLYDNPTAGLGSYLTGSMPGLPFGVRSIIGIPRAHYFDTGNKEDAKLHKLLSEQFPGSTMTFVNFTTDGKQLLFFVSSDRDPGSYYLFNRTTGKADLLFPSMPDIEPDDMAERRPVSFKARDGLELNGYLTVPKHAPGTRLPLVLIPHGGPHGVYDTWYFDTDSQFLASRGYAVLQVNYRGSGTRGKNFLEAGYRQWGAKIQDDLIDGVKWAIAQGEIDGKRVCSYGASFGAYSALMLAAREPALFKCAVGYAGIYDLNLIYKEDHVQREKYAFNYWNKAIGQDKDELNRFSPVTLADKISSPVLLVHGGKDKTAPIEHAEAMRAALIKVGRAPEWLVAPNEGHGFYDTKNVTMFYEKLQAFLDTHIGK